MCETTNETGSDITAGYGASILRVASKREASSNIDSPRYGNPFELKKSNSRVPRALYTASKVISKN